MTKTTKEILIEAAELIDEKGKAIGVFYSSFHDCYCTVGAIGKVIGKDVINDFFWGDRKVLKVTKVLATHLGLSTLGNCVSPDLYSWSDTTPAPDIADAMRKAAEGL